MVDLEKWDKRCFDFIYLLSLLPAFNYIRDLNIYWKHSHENDSYEKIYPIIEKLLHIGLIKVQDQVDG